MRGPRNLLVQQLYQCMIEDSEAKAKTKGEVQRPVDNVRRKSHGSAWRGSADPGYGLGL